MFDTLKAILLIVAVIAFLVEYAIQALKKVYGSWKYQAYVDVGLALGLNILLACLLHLNVLDAFSATPTAVTVWVGQILTGTLGSGGSRAIHKILGTMKK